MILCLLIIWVSCAIMAGMITYYVMNRKIRKETRYCNELVQLLDTISRKED